MLLAGCASRLPGPGGPDVVPAAVSALPDPVRSPEVSARDGYAVYERRTALGRDVHLVGGPGAPPAGGADASRDLAKASQNPIADLISLPFQNNTNFGVGPEDKVQDVLNVQPVVPLRLSSSWNVINRLILPVVWQEEDAIPGVDTQLGLGDLTYTAFFSPRASGKVIWGAGPVFLLPTAASQYLGTEKWGAGPSVVVLTMPGKWVIGALANQIWSFAGEDDRADVNRFLVQPFVNYNLPQGWFLTSAPILTADWDAPSGEQWTVPLGGGFGRVFPIGGGQPVSVTLQAYYNVERPDDGADWTLRFGFTFLFPKK